MLFYLFGFTKFLASGYFLAFFKYYNTLIINKPYADHGKKCSPETFFPIGATKNVALDVTNETCRP